jgi:hypothetical protein
LLWFSFSDTWPTSCSFEPVDAGVHAAAKLDPVGRRGAVPGN